MGDSAQGERLIVLASQPRSGSTLLQRMLGQLPTIHTHSEPWILLHPLYALRRRGYVADYDAALARQALDEFISILPEGESDYFEAIRRMATYLYERALDKSDARYYLDKTPRYHRILPEIAKVLPKAKLVILHRHPLAVLISVVQTWGLENLYLLADDLLAAPRRLVEARDHCSSRCHAVWYEQLVREPESTLRDICDFLDVEFKPNTLSLPETRKRWSLGDQDTAFRLTEPNPSKTREWQEGLRNPQVWRLASDYFERLGPGLVQALGYSSDETQRMLDSTKPSLGIGRLVVPFSAVIEPPSRDRKINAIQRQLALTLVRKERSSRSDVGGGHAS